ncbi:MAG: TetR/AcrR family transcriptional regulator [Lachnospiraceae bacterium]|nr:TetR/AcrR family transcriptional regulator [Lachnospiraceae bacterium]
MRIVKEAAERKNEILDTAAELFAAKGYEETSTGDILDRVGIARGTLYYHFKSKEDILDALIDRVNGILIAKAKEAAADRSLPVVERLIRTIMSLNVTGEAGIGREVLEQVHKPQNALMHQKMQQSLLDGVIPVLTGLVEEGNAQGVFHVKYPSETTEMLVLYPVTVFDECFQQTPEQLTNRVHAFIHNTEILLGAEEGSMAAPMATLFERGF